MRLLSMTETEFERRKAICKQNGSVASQTHSGVWLVENCEGAIEGYGFTEDEAWLDCVDDGEEWE